MQYIRWHYVTAWTALFSFWCNLTIFPLFLFSVPRHITTLFSPWKRQRPKRSGPGLHLVFFLDSLSFTLISRSIGCVLRLGLIFLGVSFSLILFLPSGIPYLIWPFLFGFSYLWYMNHGLSDDQIALHLMTLAHENLQSLSLLLVSHPLGAWIVRRSGIDPTYVSRHLAHQNDRGNWHAFVSSLHLSDGTLSPSLFFGQFFSSVVSSYPPFQKIFSDASFFPEDIAAVGVWQEQEKTHTQKPLLFDFDRIRRFPGIGFDWAYGYTPKLDAFADDVVRLPHPYPRLFGQDALFSRIERALSKTEHHNVLLVGQPGTARHAILDSLARRMQTGQTTLLAHTRIFFLRMHAILSEYRSADAVKHFLHTLLGEALDAGNIILALDDVDRYVSSPSHPVPFDITDVLEKFTDSRIRFLALTTPDAYHRQIADAPLFLQMFETIPVDPPSIATVFQQLACAIVPILEEKYGVFLSFPVLKTVVSRCEEFYGTDAFPGKAIDLLDSVCIFSLTGKTKHVVLTPEDVDAYLSEVFHTTLGRLKQNETHLLLHLEAVLHRRIVNQHTAITALSSSLRRARLHVSDKSRPIGTFLFLGPTGVGKTETAKTLAAAYYGSDDAFIRFDMSAYQGEDGLHRLIGDGRTGMPGELTSKLSARPFSLLFFDELEKTDQTVSNLFLPLLDEGYIVNHLGKTVDARHTLILATSNAGSDEIHAMLRENVPYPELSSRIVASIISQRIFSPEFLNRFDALIVFSPLSEGHLREVARRMLQGLNERLREHHISVQITPSLVSSLASAGHDCQFGARAMRRILSEKIESVVASRLLEGRIRKGDTLSFEFSS